MDIGQLLRRARKERGYTAEQVAELLDFTTPTITRWENGAIDISSSMLSKYCEAIGITLAELFSRSTRSHLPILGTIRAGVPILAQESYDGYLDVPDSIRADFALRVVGDSMIGAGILDGDLAICRESKTANSGQIVVGIKQIDTEYAEATLKYYFNNGNGPVLRPANPNYQNLRGYEVQGIMVALIREGAPGYHVYQDYLTVAGHDDWTGVIETAAVSGIKPEHIMAYIDMVKGMGKQ